MFKPSLTVFEINVLIESTKLPFIYDRVYKNNFYFKLIGCDTLDKNISCFFILKHEYIWITFNKMAKYCEEK